jgi:hypothetical protein
MEDMKDQLRDRYLKNNQCRMGFYFVTHFSTKTWCPTDHRKAKSEAVTTGGLRCRLAALATSLSEGVSLTSYVLDASLDSTAAEEEQTDVSA